MQRKDLIPEGENVLESCFGAGGKLVLEYLEDCKSGWCNPSFVYEQLASGSFLWEFHHPYSID